MRNLKKLMALVMAVVMVFALASIASAVGYADITDKDDITNKDAVALLVDLGVINGIKQADGTIAYKPNDIVDRATMAKLISFVKIGDVDASVFAGTTTDLTDIANTWSEGYVKYCYANGIISGDGAGHFFPTTSVNVVSAAKMLLVALGYDPQIQGYVGANWAVNIMKDATTAGLLDGITASATSGLTRDGAALMIYNALDAKEAYYTNFTGNTVQFKNNTLGLATYGLQEIKGIVTGYTDDTTTIQVSDDVSYTLDVAGDPTLIGRKVSAYAEVKTTQTTANFVTSTTAVVSALGKYTVNDTISSACVTVDKVLATSVNGTTYAKLTTKTDSKYIGYTANTGVTFYYNGNEVVGAVDGHGGYPADTETLANNVTAVKAYAAERGVTVQFVDTDADSKYDAVYFTEYGLSYVKSTTAAKTGVEATVTLNDVQVRGENAVDESNVVGDFDSLAKKDVVMYAVIGSSFGKLFVYEPTTFEGKMTSFKSAGKTLTIDSATYTTTSGTTNKGPSGVTVSENISANGTAKFYVDQNGYIVAMTDVDEEVNYCAIDKIAWVTGTGVNSSGYAEAKLVFADGTTKVVTVASINDIDELVKTSTVADTAATAAGPFTSGFVTSAGHNNAATYYTSAETSVSVPERYAFEDGVTAANNSAYKYTTCTYSINSDGEYELTINSESKLGNDYGTALTAGTASFTNGSAAGNSSTIYVVKTTSGDTTKWTVYTGYKNCPKVTSAKINIAKEEHTDAYAAFVYVDATSGSVGKTQNDYVYITNAADSYGTSGTGSDKYYTFDGLVDGDSEFSTVMTKTYSYLNSGEGLYKVTFDADGYVSSATLYTADTDFDTYAELTTTVSYFQGVASAAPSGGVFRVKNAGDTTVNYFTYDDTTKVYFIEDGEISSTYDEITDIEENWTVYTSVVDITDTNGSDVLALDTLFVVVPD